MISWTYKIKSTISRYYTPLKKLMIWINIVSVGVLHAGTGTRMRRLIYPVFYSSWMFSCLIQNLESGVLHYDANVYFYGFNWSRISCFMMIPNFQSIFSMFLGINHQVKQKQFYKPQLHSTRKVIRKCSVELYEKRMRSVHQHWSFWMNRRKVINHNGAVNSQYFEDIFAKY